ncbi:hypothetical protein [Pseudoduganella albidiflava]|uniref:Outer membrane lipoprotein carrier protein LolA n=1 Tax=Pseudoduganella albidiflava TaxID=321983 RepID=A0A411X197_9BURK|nr:hypothetical protein [Pseudoduganella albidiflava]QBI02645.1 hypothetical protein EYF70_18695 [Pseudoduganella albidiflava]GGY41021.1 hypothetical protein GCM10007387_23700 [Pseudoduganella albidiflava]
MTVPASRTDRCFVIINRLVSLLLLLALLGMLAGAAVLGYLSLARGPVKGPGMVKAEEKTAEAGKRVVLGFAAVEKVHGADIDMVRLVVMDRERDYSYERSDGTRNVLFIHGAGQPSHWLFKEHGNTVTVLRQLQESEHRAGSPALALYIEYTTPRPADAVPDGRRPVLNFGLARPDGTGMTVVLKDITRVLSHRVTAERRVTVLFQRGTALWQATIALDDFTIVGEREVARLPTSI